MSEARTTPAPSAASTCGKVPAGGIVELSESRAKIDAIDREIVRLFEERMRVSHDVASPCSIPCEKLRKSPPRQALQTMISSSSYRRFSASSWK